jgi:hypothetical protein
LLRYGRDALPHLLLAFGNRRNRHLSRWLFRLIETIMPDGRTAPDSFSGSS